MRRREHGAPITCSMQRYHIEHNLSSLTDIAFGTMKCCAALPRGALIVAYLPQLVQRQRVERLEACCELCSAEVPHSGGSHLPC